MHFLSRKQVIVTELAVFLIGLPFVMWLFLPPIVILPVVWGMAVLCHHLANFARPDTVGHWWRRDLVTRAEILVIWRRFAICATLLFLLTYAFKPELLFNLVRGNPGFWLLIMFAYPLLSVVPQEIIFRRYLFARFEGLFSPGVLLLVSGLGFGFAHIVFHNWVAPSLCAIGGLMFARTYRTTRSLALVSLEHALYGDFVFTLGLGRYFYHGAVAVAQS